jgi:excisionase family DNA binding protein
MKLDQTAKFSNVTPHNAVNGMLFDNQEWLTTEEAAKYLRVSIGALRNMTSNGQVPYYKLLRRNRYRIEDLRNLLTKKGGFYD